MDLHRVARPFLPDREWDRIFEVCPADLYNLLPLSRFGDDGCLKRFDFGKKSFLDLFDGRDMHGCRKGVVRALRHVHMVVRMNWGLGSEDAAEHLDATIGDDFVHIHVALCAASGLPYVQRKVLIELTGDHLIRNLEDQFGLLFRQMPEALIDQCSRFLNVAVCMVDLDRHAVVADREMDERTLCLGPPKAICRHLYLSHGVELYSPVTIVQQCPGLVAGRL